MFNKVNREFARKIVQVFTPGALIWVHNYQLMLTPTFLQSSLPSWETERCICLFMHQPFPSSEYFRTLSVREEVLRGMLNADLLGFHSYDDA